MTQVLGPAGFSKHVDTEARLPTTPVYPKGLPFQKPAAQAKHIEFKDLRIGAPKRPYPQKHLQL